VKESDKLYILNININEEKKDETIQVVSGIKKHYGIEQLIDKKVIVLTNLKPSKMLGNKSEGMVLVSSKDDKITLLKAESHLLNGTNIYPKETILKPIKNLKLLDFQKIDFKVVDGIAKYKDYNLISLNGTGIVADFDGKIQ
jgi:tRNA-binding EMAP/Myf-like protein